MPRRALEDDLKVWKRAMRHLAQMLQCACHHRFAKDCSPKEQRQLSAEEVLAHWPEAVDGKEARPLALLSLVILLRFFDLVIPAAAELSEDEKALVAKARQIEKLWCAACPEVNLPAVPHWERLLPVPYDVARTIWPDATPSELRNLRRLRDLPSGQQHLDPGPSIDCTVEVLFTMEKAGKDAFETLFVTKEDDFKEKLAVRRSAGSNPRIQGLHTPLMRLGLRRRLSSL